MARERILNSLKDIERAAGRVERSMQEAFSRLSDQSLDLQVEGITGAISRALEDVPPALRTIVIEMLSDVNTTAPGRIEDRDLLAEIAFLRAKQVEYDAKTMEQPVATADGLQRVVEAMFGQDSVASDAVTAEGLASAVVLLCGFVEDLANAFAPSTGRAEKGTNGRNEELDQALGAQLRGEDGLGRYLESLKAKVGTLAMSLPGICAGGARSLLEELEPAVVEDGARGAGRVGIGPFKYRDLWLAFERRHMELVAEEDLYERYFDGHLKRLVHRSRPRR